MGIMPMIVLALVEARGGTASEADEVYRILGPQPAPVIPSEAAEMVDRALRQVRSDTNDTPNMDA